MSSHLPELTERCVEDYINNKRMRAIRTLGRRLRDVVAKEKPAGRSSEFENACCTLMNFITAYCIEHPYTAQDTSQVEALDNAEFLGRSASFFRKMQLFLRCNAQYQTYRGSLYVAMGQRKLALQAFNDALQYEQQVTSPQAYAMCYLFPTNKGVVLTRYNQVHAVASLYSNLAAVQAQLKHYHNAIENCHLALKLINEQVDHRVGELSPKETNDRVYSLACVISYNLGCHYEGLFQDRNALNAYKASSRYSSISTDPQLTDLMEEKIDAAIERVTCRLYPAAGTSSRRKSRDRASSASANITDPRSSKLNTMARRAKDRIQSQERMRKTRELNPMTGKGTGFYTEDDYLPMPVSAPLIHNTGHAYRPDDPIFRVPMDFSPDSRDFLPNISPNRKSSTTDVFLGPLPASPGVSAFQQSEAMASRSGHRSYSPGGPSSAAIEPLLAHPEYRAGQHSASPIKQIARRYDPSRIGQMAPNTSPDRVFQETVDPPLEYPPEEPSDELRVVDLLCNGKGKGLSRKAPSRGGATSVNKHGSRSSPQRIYKTVDNGSRHSAQLTSPHAMPTLVARKCSEAPSPVYSPAAKSVVHISEPSNHPTHPIGSIEDDSMTGRDQGTCYMAPSVPLTHTETSRQGPDLTSTNIAKINDVPLHLLSEQEQAIALRTRIDSLRNQSVDEVVEALSQDLSLRFLLNDLLTATQAFARSRGTGVVPGQQPETTPRAVWMNFLLGKMVEAQAEQHPQNNSDGSTINRGPPQFLPTTEAHPPERDLGQPLYQKPRANRPIIKQDRTRGRFDIFTDPLRSIIELTNMSGTETLESTNLQSTQMSSLFGSRMMRDTMRRGGLGVDVGDDGLINLML